MENHAAGPERRTLSLDDEARPSPFFAGECTPPSSDSLLSPVAPVLLDAAARPEDAEPAPLDLPEVEFQDAPPPPPPRRTRHMPVAPDRDPTLPPLRWRDRVWLPSPVAVLVVLALLGGMYVHHNWNRRLPVTPEHRACVVTAARLATFLDEEVGLAGTAYGFEVDPRAESFDVHRRLGGTLTLDYRYAGRGAGQPTLEVQAVVHRSAAAARTAYRAHEIGAVVARGGLGEGIVERVELDADCRWGDRSSAALVLRGSNPVGHDFLARSGRVTLAVKLRGVALRDGWELRRLLAPTLDALAAHE